jgi:hypothetical protein
VAETHFSPKTHWHLFGGFAPRCCIPIPGARLRCSLWPDGRCAARHPFEAWSLSGARSGGDQSEGRARASSERDKPGHAVLLSTMTPAALALGEIYPAPLSRIRRWALTTIPSCGCTHLISHIAQYGGISPGPTAVSGL